eukprot:s1742_g5.t1
MGGPVAVRANSSWAGTWSGVATLSDLPSNEVALPYSAERACGRLLCTRHSFGFSSLLNVVVYGFPAGPSWPQSKQLTTDLLEVVTREIVLGAKGPRIIGGDMNAGPNQLPTFDFWRSHGWCSAQDFALSAWGQSKAFTCKGSTEPDQAWLSPEVQALCRQVAVSDHFMEHATVGVGLQVPTSTSVLFTWPRPSAIPYDELDTAWLAHAQPPHWDDHAAVDEQWSQLASTFESCFDGFVPSQPSASLTRNQKGRLQLQRPVKRQCQTLTLRSSRPGEVAMRSQLLGHDTRLWFRQLRRLQSYLHAIKAAKMTLSAITYRLELWSSILQASGFVGGFAHWWLHHPDCQAAGPGPLPFAPPGLEVAHHLFSTFKLAYENFESWHLRQRGKILKAKYDKGMNGIHHDLRKAPRDRLDSLHYTHSYGVLAVEAGQLHLDHPISLGGASHWTSDDIALQATSINEVVLQVDAPCEVGDVLVQHQHISQIPELHQALLDYWTPIWNAMSTVPSADWDRVQSFFAAYVPRLHFDLPDITEPMWRAALKRYKPTAARGVDGLSHFDLLAMPSAWTTRLLSLLRKIELGETTWPMALLYGVVSVIAKDVDSQTVDRFRPIVVFSVIYRTWASIRSRQLLRQLAPHMDSGAYGFIPGCEPSQLWLLLQSDIECNLLLDADMTGLSTDLIRAFNNIPRQHSFALASHLGVPATLLLPWKSFLTNCTRAFEVHGWHSSVTTSCCGLPEGDALSVYAMVQLNMAWHLYMRAFCPQVRAMSFVDNLAIVTSAVEHLVRGLACLVEFFRLWNLAIDNAKSYCWAWRPLMRRQLHAVPFKQATSALELGGVLSFTKRQFTGQQHKKFLALETRWKTLQSSWAPLRQKLAVLPMTFWTSALHGVYGACFGESHLEKLRSHATAALRLRRARSNPLLRLSLSSTPSADPGLWRAIHTIRALRRLAAKEPRLLTNWKFFMPHFEGDMMSGPFSQLLRSATALDLALISSLQSGCFMSSAQHAKYDLTKGAFCPVCGLADDPLHWLECPRYAHLRTEVSGWQATTPHDTTALRMHLLPSRSPHAGAWKQALMQIPDQSDTFYSTPGQGMQHVFTDGTATKTGTPFDIAAWGCLNATTGQIVAAGHVPGLSQTSARAELHAALGALRWQHQHHVLMTLWLDAKFVSDGIEFIQLHGEAADWSNGDLWTQIAEYINAMPSNHLVPRWIPSHLDPALLECPYEEWVHLWNDRIDNLVGRLNHNRPFAFQRLWHAACDHHTEVVSRLKQLSNFFGRVAATPKAVEVELTEDVQPVSDSLFTLHDLYTSDVEDELHSMSDTSAISIPFLISILRWLISFDVEHSAAVVVDEAYHLCYEEWALLLADQHGFCFPFWNSATQSMDTCTLCSRYTKPTLAYVVSAIRKSCLFLKINFPVFGSVVFDSQSKVHLGIHRPCCGLLVRKNHQLVQKSNLLMKRFTHSRAIARTLAA